MHIKAHTIEAMSQEGTGKSTRIKKWIRKEKTAAQIFREPAC